MRLPEGTYFVNEIPVGYYLKTKWGTSLFNVSF